MNIDSQSHVDTHIHKKISLFEVKFKNILVLLIQQINVRKLEAGPTFKHTLVISPSICFFSAEQGTLASCADLLCFGANSSAFPAQRDASGEEVIVKGITYVSVSQNAPEKNHLKVTVKNTDT